MPVPTIESRLQRRALMLSPRCGVVDALRAIFPAGWALECAVDPADVGGFEDVLQFRMVLVDLDLARGWDPVGSIATIRTDMLLNVPVLCFGGDEQARDAARRMGADRFFDFDGLVRHIPEFCTRLGW